MKELARFCGHTHVIDEDGFPERREGLGSMVDDDGVGRSGNRFIATFKGSLGVGVSDGEKAKSIRG